MTNLVICQVNIKVVVTNLVKVQFNTMTTKTNSLIPKELFEEMRPERIGHRLKLLRIANDLSSSEMADTLGIERTYWSRFENGKRPVSDSVAALLVSKFGVTLDFLILGRWDKLPFDLAEKLREVELKNK